MGKYDLQQKAKNEEFIQKEMRKRYDQVLKTVQADMQKQYMEL
jgi:hypothetical protein